MAVLGAIAERVQGIIPITWDALANDARYGDGFLRTAIDISKENVTGTNVDPDTEDAYSLIVIDFIAKLATIEIISAGIDFWMNQPISESATGTNENHAFVDRADKLAALRNLLLEETRRKAAEVAAILNFSRPGRTSRPLLNTIDDPFLTPSPQEFPRPYTQSTFS